jgi:hypothetical protein
MTNNLPITQLDEPEKTIRNNSDSKFFITYCRSFSGIERLLDAVLATRYGILVVMTPMVSEYPEELKKALSKGDFRFRLYEISFATDTVLQQRAQRFNDKWEGTGIIIQPNIWNNPVVNSNEFFG